MGAVARFWHRIAREQTVARADDSTLEMFEGLTQEQVNDALYRFDSEGGEIRRHSRPAIDPLRLRRIFADPGTDSDEAYEALREQMLPPRGPAPRWWGPLVVTLAGFYLFMLAAVAGWVIGLWS